MLDSSYITRSSGPNSVAVITSDNTGLFDVQNRYFHAPVQISALLTASSVSTYIWTCTEGEWQLERVRVATSTASTSGTLDARHCTATTAPGSGTTQLTGTVSLSVAGPVQASGVLIASPTIFVPGDSLAAVFGGTMTSLVASATFVLKRIR